MLINIETNQDIGRLIKLTRFRYGLHLEKSEFTVTEEKFDLNKMVRWQSGDVFTLDNSWSKQLELSVPYYGVVIKHIQNNHSKIFIAKKNLTMESTEKLLLAIKKSCKEGEEIWRIYHNNVIEPSLLLNRKMHKIFEEELKKIKEMEERNNRKYVRITHCWQCLQTKVSSATHFTCPSCFGIICKCGACYRDCDSPSREWRKERAEFYYSS